MQTISAVLVLFIFTCVVFPNLVRNKAQFHAGFGLVIAVVILYTVGEMLRGSGTAAHVFVFAIAGLLQVGAILLLYLSSGGITWRSLAGDMKDAYEVIRRGESTKEVIIPLRGKGAAGGEDVSRNPPQ